MCRVKKLVLIKIIIKCKMTRGEIIKPTVSLEYSSFNGKSKLGYNILVKGAYR